MMAPARISRMRSVQYTSMTCPCKMTPIKIVMLIFNISLATICLFLFIAGCVLVSGKSAYGSELDFLRQTLHDSATARGAENLDESNLDIVFITYPMGLAFIVVSLITGGGAVLGIVVSVMNSHKILFIYSVIIFGNLFAQSVLLMCSYMDKTPFEKNVKSMLKETLIDFTGLDGEDSITLGWNSIMAHKNCCGVDGYEDFQVSANWVKTIDGANQFSNVQTPFMCCKNAVQVPTCTRPALFEAQTYYNQGCYEQIWDLAISDHGSVICFVYFLLVIEFMCLFMAVWKICERKAKMPAKVNGFSNT